jgi:hypothetical protein
MAKTAMDRQSRLAHTASGAVHALSMTCERYLHTMRALLQQYQHASVVQQQIFVTMMQTFMEELCGYPRADYRMTSAIYSPPAVGSVPHVVPIAYAANLTLFYFTAAEHPDDVQDLWVRHAQVYLATYDKGDLVAECATTVVCSNFFVIDGASKDPTTGAWHLWSVSDLEAAQAARVDLRHLEEDTAPAAPLSHTMYERLQTLQYQTSLDARCMSSMPGDAKSPARARP